MPKFRDIYIEKAKTLADLGSLVVDLNVVDPVSVLLVNFSATNGAISNKNNPLARNITKIEVVDGSDILFSMDCRLAQALAYYWQKTYPYKAWQEYGGGGQADSFPIFFGRHLWDPVYALNPAKFRNPQVKISWNLATVNPVGATGFASGSLKMSIMARLMEGMAAPPTHFMMHKDHYSFTSAASGDERVPLPTDYPWAMFMLRAWESGVGINSSITKVKLSLDVDKDIPFDHSIGRQGLILENSHGLIHHGIRMFGDDAEVHQVWLAMQERANLTGETDTIIAMLQNLVNGQLTLGLKSDANVALTAKMIQCQVQGSLPWNCVAFPFGLLEDPATYLQVQTYGDIKAILTQGNVGAEVNLVLSQLREYKA